MALPSPEWKEDHLFIPSGLMELLYQGFVIYIRIKKPENDFIIETTIRKEKPAEKTKPQKIAPMAVYLQQFMPEALDLLNRGFNLEVHVSSKEIKVTAEKTL